MNGITMDLNAAQKSIVLKLDATAIQGTMEQQGSVSGKVKLVEKIATKMIFLTPNVNSVMMDAKTPNAMTGAMMNFVIAMMAHLNACLIVPGLVRWVKEIVLVLYAM
tara:strand:- start:234 stop:554 length:321 start_codon:yes stop_codon:yes gene_type:complete